MPKAPEAAKPARTESQFGTSLQPTVPGGGDEFDPATFNRMVSPNK
jgi:hypothetical protein